MEKREYVAGFEWTLLLGGGMARRNLDAVLSHPSSPTKSFFVFEIVDEDSFQQWVRFLLELVVPFTFVEFLPRGFALDGYPTYQLSPV